MKYGFSLTTNLSFEATKEKIIELLKQEEFGILTEIDVKNTLKEKLDVDFDKYVILGACNPPFAHQALMVEKEVGLLLPCNIIVYEEDQKTKVSIINPLTAMSIVDNPKLEKIAQEITEKIKNVINELEKLDDDEGEK